MNQELLTQKTEEQFGKLLGVLLLKQDKSAEIDEYMERFALGNSDLVDKIKFTFAQLERKMNGLDFQVTEYSEVELEKLQWLTVRLLGI